jgi:hypothetical protein
VSFCCATSGSRQRVGSGWSNRCGNRAFRGRATLDSDVRVATKAETDAKNAVLSALKDVQGAAKRKYARTTPQQTKDHFLGEDIDSRRARRLQVADSVLEELKTDTQPDASKERIAIEAAARSIIDRRIQIHFAADVQWPASDKADDPRAASSSCRKTGLLAAERE